MSRQVKLTKDNLQGSLKIQSICQIDYLFPVCVSEILIHGLNLKQGQVIKLQNKFKPKIRFCLSIFVSNKQT